MPRPMLKEPAPLKWEASLVPDVAHSYDIDVVTPMFGGGAVAKQCDPNCPVRPAEVRGHLRFWWRALYGGRYATSEELAKAESAIWGSDSERGRLAISVVILNAGKPELAYDPGKAEPKDTRWPGYALFPYQYRMGETPTFAQVGVRFRLEVRSCGLGDRTFAEIRSAVAAWIAFGGIGARTRRGCGSLSCDRGGSMHVEPTVSPIRIPLIDGSVLVVGPQSFDPTAAWKAAVDLYREFRQGTPFVRPTKFGKSQWPEPDALRRMTGRWKPMHRRTTGPNLFPRADLGLPIVFHFPQQSGIDATLQGSGKGKQRMASPVITRAYRQNGKWYPMVLLLSTPHAWDAGTDLELKGDVNGTVTRGQVEMPARGPVDPAPPASGPIRTELISFVSKKWKVKPQTVRPSGEVKP